LGNNGSADVSASFPEITANAGKNFAGAAGSIWDDYGSPNVIGDSLLVWLRSFSDNVHYARAYQYDLSFNLVSGPVDFLAIQQTMSVATTNQVQIGAFDGTTMILTYDSGHFIYLATLGPVPSGSSARRFSALCRPQ